MLKKRNSEQIDIIFEAGEDLWNSQKSQVVVLKNNSIRLPITRPRTFLSYSFEFCGITGLDFKSLRFQSLGRDIRVSRIHPETNIMTACMVKVIHTSEFAQLLQNPLKTSLQQLFNSGSFSDITLKINEDKVTDNKIQFYSQSFSLHKSILSCRSAKFNGMFSSNLIENTTNVVKVEYKKPDLFKLMLQWIYSGIYLLNRAIKFPEDIEDTCDLLLLADEYMLVDLKQKCEEDISSKLNVTNLLQILLFAEKHSEMVSQFLIEKTHNCFIEEFDKILKINPSLEKDITQVPGLITKLFQNVHSKKLKKPRKVHFVVDDYENQQETDSDNNSQDYIRNYTQHFYQ